MPYYTIAKWFHLFPFGGKNQITSRRKTKNTNKRALLRRAEKKTKYDEKGR